MFLSYRAVDIWAISAILSLRRLVLSITLSENVMMVDGKPAVSDDLKNELAVKCSRCEQTYRLGYSDNEWHRVKDLLRLAETAIRKEHDSRHEATMIPLDWRGIRKRQERGLVVKMVPSLALPDVLTAWARNRLCGKLLYHRLPTNWTVFTPHIDWPFALSCCKSDSENPLTQMPTSSIGMYLSG